MAMIISYLPEKAFKLGILECNRQYCALKPLTIEKYERLAVCAPGNNVRIRWVVQNAH